MPESMNYTCRIDPVVRKKSEAVYATLGVNLSTAINVFLRESIRSGGFPFDVRLKTNDPAPSAEAVIPAQPVQAAVAEPVKEAKKKKKAKK